MKIIFLCVSLEPGRDGVGDYTRRLARELVRSGHNIEIISIHDTFVQKVGLSEIKIDFESILLLRIPFHLKPKKKFELIKERLKQNNPDWVSLQYVGFGFQRYGLPWEFFYHFKPILKNVKLHIMLHELWCGMDDFAGWKEKILGVLQKFFLKGLLYHLKAQKIFTSIEYYAVCLKEIDITASIIPIFSNVPLEEKVSEDEWNNLLTGYTFTLNDDKLIVGFFGTVYPCPGLEVLLRTTAEVAVQKGRSLAIMSVGRNNSRQLNELLASMKDVTYWEMGALPSTMVNRAVRMFDVGVLTSPASRFNKSGTGIALNDRGIPLLVSADDKTYNKDQMLKQGIFQIRNHEDFLEALESKGKWPFNCRLNKVAEAYASLNLSN